MPPIRKWIIVVLPIVLASCLLFAVFYNSTEFDTHFFPGPYYLGITIQNVTIVNSNELTIFVKSLPLINQTEVNITTYKIMDKAGVVVPERSLNITIPATGEIIAIPINLEDRLLSGEYTMTLRVDSLHLSLGTKFSVI